MVSTGRYVRFATQFGVYKIQRNILAIQQTLCNVTDGAEDSILNKAQRYWQLYDLGPKVSSASLCDGSDTDLMSLGHAGGTAESQTRVFL